MKPFNSLKIAKSLRYITNSLKGNITRRSPEKAFKRPVYLFDENEVLLEEYESKRVCAEKLGFTENQLLQYIKYKKPINGMYFSYGKNLFL